MQKKQKIERRESVTNEVRECVSKHEIYTQNMKEGEEPQCINTKVYSISKIFIN